MQVPLQGSLSTMMSASCISAICFYNGKSKAGSACFAGPAFIDPVESFEDPLLLIFRNADAGVLYRKERVIIQGKEAVRSLLQAVPGQLPHPDQFQLGLLYCHRRRKIRSLYKITELSVLDGTAFFRQDRDHFFGKPDYLAGERDFQKDSQDGENRVRVCHLMAYISGCETLDQFREREHRDQDQHQSGSEQVEEKVQHGGP